MVSFSGGHKCCSMMKMITMTEHHDEYHDEYNDEYNGRAQMLQHCDQDECGDGDSFK